VRSVIRYCCPSNDNEKVLIVLLPGMDGTGILLRPFVDLLPNGIDVKVISYPEDTYLTYEQLAERVLGVVPRSEPYVIIAESYSGPVACLIAAHPALFRSRAPACMLRWLLMDADTPPEMISEAQDVIARVRPEVMAQRLRDSLSADFAPILRDCTVRIVCLSPESDRLLGTRWLRGFLAAKPGIETVQIAGPHSILQCAPASCLAVLQKTGVFGDS
jgi:hypothetical protein